MSLRYLLQSGFYWLEGSNWAENEGKLVFRGQGAQ